MSTQPLPHINTQSVFDEFAYHLKEEFNERILFSAPFGSGKSTFLNKFFDGRTDQYIVLKLYPVNYSVTQNEDVFEAVKYDLLYELLNKFPEEVEIDNEEFSKLMITQMFLLHQMKIDLPLKLLTKAAELSSESVDEVTKIFKEFLDYKTQINHTDYKRLDTYIKSFRKKKGHAHESDEITELIIKMLDNLKTKASKEKEFKTVLLIDDLDRLDPEHVFRLFNIFSAHYDEVHETNKFGFDKIIFVCDVNNIQQMFYHRYGIHAEFNGYIDKFYSSEVFRFNINRYLKNSIRQILEAKEQLLKYYPERNLKGGFLSRYTILTHDGFRDVMGYILNKMIDAGVLKIRNFKRLKAYSIPNYRFNVSGHNQHVANFPLLVLFFNLERFFTKPTDLEDVLLSLSERFQSDYAESNNNDSYNRIDSSEHSLIRLSIPFLIDPQITFYHKFNRDQQYYFPFLNEKDETIYVSYTPKINWELDNLFIDYNNCRKIESPNVNGVPAPALPRPNPFWFLYKAYKEVKANDYL